MVPCLVHVQKGEGVESHTKALVTSSANMLLSFSLLSFELNETCRIVAVFHFFLRASFENVAVLVPYLWLSLLIEDSVVV